MLASWSIAQDCLNDGREAPESRRVCVCIQCALSAGVDHRGFHLVVTCGPTDPCKSETSNFRAQIMPLLSRSSSELGVVFKACGLVVGVGASLYQMRSSSSTQLSAPPRVALMGAGILCLYCALMDLRPTPATDTAAPRMRTSEARVTSKAGEAIVRIGLKGEVWGCRVGGVVKTGFC